LLWLATLPKKQKPLNQWLSINVIPIINSAAATPPSMQAIPYTPEYIS
jgi:hypothetical protein